jgi:thioredoxin reductase (NADPH)
VGGEVPRINLPIRNYLGLSALDGRAFLREVELQTERLQPSLRFGVEISRVDPVARRVETNAETFGARGMILATGLRRRTLDLPGADQLNGRGLSYSATRDRDRLTGHEVAVLGGGDGAMENALILADVCPRVVLLHRGDELDGRRAFAARVMAHPRVEVQRGVSVVGLEGGEGCLSAVKISGPGGARTLQLSWLVVKIGFVPNTDLLDEGTLALDDEGYVLVDRYMRTSVAGVFAAGDVSNPRAPCIAAAVGDGAVAARQVQGHLERTGEETA